MDNYQRYNEHVEHLRKSPMFNLSLSSNELFHSNFLSWIWNCDPEAFKKIISLFVGKEFDIDRGPDKSIEVRREYKNFDLSIVERNGEEEGRVLFVLENKVKSVPYIEQIEEYIDKINVHNDRFNTIKHEKTPVTLLTLIDNFPDRNSLVNKYSSDKNIDLRIITYSDYIDFLETLKLSAHDYMRVEYCNYVKNLVSLSAFWVMREFSWNSYFLGWDNNYRGLEAGNDGYNYHFPAAVELRLHSLYHKLKSIQLCSDLKNLLEERLGKSCNILSISASDDHILIKSSRQGAKYKRRDEYFNKKQFLVGVGYGYTNNTPLLDVKVVNHKDNFIYIIQIQGVQYRHGIVAKHPSKVQYCDNWMSRTRENDNEIIKFSNDIMDDSVLYPKTSKKSPYNKFGDVMIYQSRKLLPEVTILSLFECIVEDVRLLTDQINNKKDL